jgi:TolB-like protein/class 3 adenylate cyclase/Tfp pilus assembly protein PilF
MERRLAAVLIADVAGYGRLSAADEEGTRARFQAELHEVLEPQIAAHRGRLVKTMGDGLLVEFRSVVDALRCAIGVQRAEAERNAALPPDRRLQFRIGINLGDVIVEGDDIHGDGVNIADRLQAMADAGGITISAGAYEQVKNRLDVGFQFLGEQRVKGSPEPVRAYRVAIAPKDARATTHKRGILFESWRGRAAATVVLALLIAAGAVALWRLWEPAIEPASIARMALPLPDAPSIAVLPFLNMSGDPQQDYFADGITDDLITDLSKVSGLFVIARNSTFVYQGRPVTPQQVSEELGVRYVLEGSVQRAGDQLRINAQLVDALSGGHAWADRFDGSLSDVFALQDKVTRSITDALAVRLTEADRIALDQRETSVPAAYDAFLRGWVHLRRNTPDDYAKAIPYLEEAARLDPDYGRAYAALALAYMLSFDAQWTDALGISEMEARQRAMRYLEAAQRYPSAFSHQVAGVILASQLQPGAALAELKEAIALDPGDAFNYAYMGAALTASGRPAEAIAHIRTAMRLDPRYPPMFDYFLGSAQFGMADFAAAATSYAAATERNPEYAYPFAGLAAAYGHLGRKEDAASAVARYNDLGVGRGGVPLTLGTAPRCGFAVSADIQRLRDGLRLAGAPEFLSTGEFAEQNRLSADAIRTLVLGRRLHGRSLWTGEERLASVSSAGVAALSGDWGLLGGGPLSGGNLRFDGDRLCYQFDLVHYCGDVLRNPGGTRAKENEFIWYNGEPFTFSLE